MKLKYIIPSLLLVAASLFAQGPGYIGPGVRVGHWLGNVMSWVWMPLFYFVIALPFALGVKLFSDPLGLRRRPGASHWHPKKLPPLDLDWARSQGSTVLHEPQAAGCKPQGKGSS